MMKSNYLERYGPWALVTGASDGLGNEFARQLASSGFNLILVARRAEILEHLASELSTKHRVKVQTIAADLSQEHGIQKVIDGTKGIDIGLLVASAGFGSAGELIDLDIHHEKKMVDLNCRALLELTHYCGLLFKARGRGGIILLSSILAFQGAAFTANYAATKAYVQTLAEGLAIEMKPHGIDMLSVAPGPINTGFAKNANMQFGMALSAEVVVSESLKSLGKKTTVRPGGLSKLLAFGLSSLVFRPLKVRLMSHVMKGMARHG